MVQCVPHQVEEADHPNKVCPHVNRFVVEHENALEQLPVAIKVDAISYFYVGIVSHKLWSFFNFTNESLLDQFPFALTLSVVPLRFATSIRNLHTLKLIT